MFGEQFYPTPKALAEELFDMHKLYENLDKEDRWGNAYVRIFCKHILDPSGGKGDLADHLVNYLKDKGMNHIHDDLHIDFCEIDPNLATILREKGSLIGTDFLEYTDALLHDLIIMNPPFATGAKHVLHAWELMHKGTILAIVNAQTLKNPFSHDRKMLARIIEEHGHFKYCEGAFSEAERKTNVEVALIALTKESQYDSSAFDFQFEKEETKIEFDQITNSQELAFAESKLVLYERMYNESKRLFSDALISFTKLRRCLNAFGAGSSPLEAVTGIDITSSDSYQRAYSKFISEVRSNAWRHILSQGDFRSRLDSRTAKDFEVFVKQQQAMAYSAKNITSVFMMIIDNQDLYQKRAIETAFNFMTEYTKENRDYFEGWKTNEAWRVGRKCILPGGCRWGEYLTGRDRADKFSTPYGYHSQWEDIDKAMCVVKGVPFETTHPKETDSLQEKERIMKNRIVTIREALENKFQILGYVSGTGYDNTCESTFFELKFFKKGTVHLKFKDEVLWERFNRFACEGRNWLPPSKDQPHESETPEQGDSQVVVYEAQPHDLF